MVLFSTVVWAFGAPEAMETDEEVSPRERPVIESIEVEATHRGDWVGYTTPRHSRLGSSLYGYGYPSHWHSYGRHGWYHPYAYGLGYHPWDVQPGRSMIWMSAGSHGHLGGGFATHQEVPESNFTVGFATSYEQGRAWFSGLDYERTEVSPWFGWRGERTAVVVGFTAGSTRYSGELPQPRPRIESGESTDSSSRVSFDERFRDTSVTGSISHRLTDRLDVNFSATVGQERLRNR